MKDARIQYRRRCSYATKSNRIRPVKTPGGKLVAHYVVKSAKGPQCADPGCNKGLQGIPRMRPAQMSRLNKHHRTVSRAYGGNCCLTCVRERIMRAFIVEEQKIVKKVILEKAKAAKAAK
mmetsp:Transcript_20755/g.28020  ORF Transcript_20755/g.28020 Transcript_20755/m.28020 type:complete len:120 (-) Transcript_20755:116-475(-)|eukprot:CAMPEP_0185579074 /NCGR_PEP_ID=MMETSP0434-20130131/13466_1 /TAXON_ID=626734 ORGANISM="Favella taraikaensis, Strain Fe Narragansett Bay" /NCGR_SAMPLE_ID=MMETSP0434 /ASSEMBLY_ACC=CAM_ASM_000379 /LENGTH=119 /DNA_ID=CAMNT_0028197025 /DNA_START=29 /DNA_END=388 /DNA_ORIENTATION=-